ncbi:putative peptidoglycan lipid II flippase [Motilibacter rhizosphaerae]|uniref:Putative peptidoglycan lipid II flippase n=1 Tax=Motilibacter rhizosphaerae TaxID=598652 RepID=A0A4Q7NVP4_9ACTN|nr:murein biosynthesis integral membrane protein MurJ [Motilibacter rhizosphaerae]RZS91214.1 putative peptidoglycan lipid II flippase [Motilibacter rhizosphaerae]
MSTSLVRSSGVMALGTVASRLLGFVRNIVLAAAIGTSVVGETFAVANTVPNMVYLLVVGGVINAVFVPQLVRAAKEHPDGGKAYTDRLLTVTVLGLLALTVVATVAAPLIVDLVYDGPAGGRPLAVLLAYWCLPQIFFYGVYTVLGQVLNARGSFGPMMWAPIANNVVAIAVGLLLLGASLDPSRPATVSSATTTLLGAGTTLGVVVQAVVLLPVLRRTGYTWTPRLDLRGSGLGKAASLARWTIGFVLVNQAAYVVVTRLSTSALADYARTVPRGHHVRGVGIAAYQNAYLFFMLPHAVVTVSLVTALLPAMSSYAADDDVRGVRRLLSRTLRLVTVAVVPASAGLVLLGSSIGGVLFSHGDNDRADGSYVGLLLAAFAAGLVPFAFHHVLLRSFYAYEDTRTPFRIACGVSATNVVLALLVTPFVPAEWRTFALACAYAASYWVALCITGSLALRKLGPLDGSPTVRTLVRTVLAAAAGTVVGAVVLHVLRDLAPSASTAVVLPEAALAGLALVLVYLAACARMHVREVPELVAALTRRGR